MAAHKCAQVPEVFKDILIASRTLAKCDAIGDDIKRRYGRDIRTAGWMPTTFRSSSLS